MPEIKPRVLIGSPIHQKPLILAEFLSSLLRLQQTDISIDYYFVDDNEDMQSSHLLREFSRKSLNTFIEFSSNRNAYVRNETTHFWNEQLIWKVAAFKNSIIQYATKLEYDYVFLVDSDLLLHPEVLQHLIAADKDIVCEIFWTQWQPNTLAQPQVWVRDEYTQWNQQRGEQLSSEDIAIRQQQFIAQLKQPGLYEVGGLGACTLISRLALNSGVNFKQIPNLSFWGEDRHFCIRAAALGFPLYVDTHYPAYHIYRDSELAGASTFIEESNAAATEAVLPAKRPRLTLSMVVKNEANRYLTEVLTAHRQYIDDAVIIDDGSTDHTVELCLTLLQGIPVRLVSNSVSRFHNEVELRKQQWQETLATNPEWILNLDADELFEQPFHTRISELLRQSDTDLFCFRLYDFWNESHYREDLIWRSHYVYRPFLLRYNKDYSYHWKETAQHCGRFPDNIFSYPHQLSELRLKHFGWATPEQRKEKYDRYRLLDPDAKFGWKAQYESIMDEDPPLIAWNEAIQR